MEQADSRELAIIDEDAKLGQKKGCRKSAALAGTCFSRGTVTPFGNWCALVPIRSHPLISFEHHFLMIR